MKSNVFKIGDKVKWVSSNTQKQGTVVGIVGPRETAPESGYPHAGGGGIWRGHESYVIEVFKNPIKRTGRKVYWPVVSLLRLEEK